MRFNETVSVRTEEAKPMGDLAQAIVSLGRAAERRRGARADLVEATDTIAKAIREQLRSGDEVNVSNQPPQMVSFAGGAAKPRQITYLAARVRPLLLGRSNIRGQWVDVLLRGHAIFGLSDASGQYEVNDWDPAEELAWPATGDDREAFVMEAEDVVKAFNVLLAKEAQDFGDAAKKAVKLTPR